MNSFAMANGGQLFFVGRKWAGRGKKMVFSRTPCEKTMCIVFYMYRRDQEKIGIVVL